MKCRICGPGASSLIAKEYLKYGELSKEDYDFFKHKEIFTDENISIIKSWLPDIERIEVTGGESFINSELFTLLELCVETDNAKHITFHTNTNGTIFNEKLNKLFKEFKYISIGFSIDDIGDRFEYQRDGGNWSKVEENLRNYQKLDLPKEFFINCTTSFLNIYYMPEFINWCVKNHWRMGFNILFLPEYNHIGNLPRYIKDKIIEKYEKLPYLLDDSDYNKDKLPKLINMMNLVEVEDDSHFKYACNEINKVDGRRNQNYSDSHPEFYKIIQEYINEKI
jgi:MoaA/NifB/PqqE/SkfB family radical SAM enzyme